MSPSGIGAELRAVRHARELSLSQVEIRSRGVWKAVVVGSYERGDRAVTVERARELLDWYGGHYLAVLHPGDVIYRGLPDGDAAMVRYWVDVPGVSRMECGTYREAADLSKVIPGARLGRQLFGPVVYSQPDAGRRLDAPDTAGVMTDDLDYQARLAAAPETATAIDDFLTHPESGQLVTIHNRGGRA